MPVTKMAIPKNTNNPTMTERLFSLALLIARNKIVIVKGFHPFIRGVKNFLKTSFAFEASVQQHDDAIAYTFCTGQIVRNDDGRSLVFFLHLVYEAVQFNTGNWI